MLTICVRCRTPFDRRTVAGRTLPSSGPACCVACASGELVDTRAPRPLARRDAADIAAPAAIVASGAAPDRLVLPIAS